MEAALQELVRVVSSGFANFGALSDEALIKVDEVTQLVVLLDVGDATIVLERVCGLITLLHDASARAMIVGRLLPPLLLCLDPRTCSPVLWTTAVSCDTDSGAASAILCIATRQSVEYLTYFHTQPGFFDLVLQCFGSRHCHIRRRACFLLESAVLPKLDLNTPLDGWRGRRSWVLDFVDVYSQVENASALHLILQVEPHLRHIFHVTSAQQHRQTSSQPLYSSVIPVPSAGWSRALVHCLLAASTPTIRKYAIHLLFSGALELRVDEECVVWLADELLPDLDSAMFFPPGSSSKDDPRHHPGILLPSFLRALISQSPQELRGFIYRRLLGRIFLMNSLCAVRWLVQLPQDLVPPSCLPSEELASLRGFLLGPLSKTNDLVRLQVLQHLLPLVLLATERSLHSLKTVMTTVVFHTGLDRTIRLAGPVLQQFVARYFESVTSLSAGSDFAANEVRLLTVAAGLLPALPESVSRLMDDLCLGIAALYHSPYASTGALDGLYLFRGLADLADVWYDGRSSEFVAFFGQFSPSNVGAISAALGHSVQAALRVSSELVLCSSLDSFEACCYGLGALLVLPSLLLSDREACVSECCDIVTACITRLNTDDAVAGFLAARSLVILLSYLRLFLEHFKLGFNSSTDRVLTVLAQAATALLRPRLTAPGRGGSRDLSATWQSPLVQSVLLKYGSIQGCESAYIACRWRAAHSAAVARALRTDQPGLQCVNLSDEMEVCPTSALPDLLQCASALVQTSSEIDSGALAGLLQSAWTAVMSSAHVSYRSLECFVGLALGGTVVRDTSFSLAYFDALFEYGMQGRPQVIRCVVCRLVGMWRADLRCILPFLPRLKDMLLFKEPAQLDTSVADVGDAAAGAVTRLVVLGFLEAIDISGMPSEVGVGMNDLIRELLCMHLKEPYIQSRMVGTEQFGHKIRSWQSLCVLSRFISEDLMSELRPAVFECLRQTCAHGIRVYEEVFTATMARKYPKRLVPELLELLREYNHPQQTLASYFVILGHLYLETSPDVDASMSPTQTRTVLRALMPWLACANGLPRSIAQVVVSRLIPRLLALDDAEDAAGSREYLSGVARYLAENKESSKLMERQVRFFTEAPLEYRATVAYLLRYKVEGDEDIIPEHLLDAITDFFKTAKSTADVLHVVDEGLPHHDDAVEEKGVDSLQTKRTSFEQLQLMLRDRENAAVRNAEGIVKQELVVIASLIDKVTNLAGIARTCEVFAVQTLVVADKRVTATDVFQGIAVSSDSWLDIAEVAPLDLVRALQEYRRKGYRILGLEQTDTSVSLASASLPGKCVLLLGHEKEGIPVRLLDEVDVCVEIPQLGVIRSLNVHVSCALAIWEISKQNRFSA